MNRSVIVLGGYGNFGRRIAAALAADNTWRVFVAGRNPRAAVADADELAGTVEPLAIDCHSSSFAAQLKRVNASALVHTAGPFQAQNYDVPRACIEAGMHYVDIADGRSYVCGIGALDAAARLNNSLVVSGASSLPALSSAVVDFLRPAFSRIDSIEYAITSGAKPPGLATLNGVMSYVGKPFKRREGGEWKTVYGWQDLTRHRYPAPIGARWIGNCDVPDLDLFPARYAPVQSVVFRAGVGFASTTLAVWAASWLVRLGLIRNLANYSAQLRRAALAIERFGTKCSAMHVTLLGVDAHANPLSRSWLLTAGRDHGPNIPCMPALALTRKLLRDEISERGALPCMGLLTVDEILSAIPDLDLHVVEVS